MNKAVDTSHHGNSHLSYLDLTYPWQSAETPLASELEATTRRWVLERGLLLPGSITKRCDSLNIGLLTALTYPGAPPSKLSIISKFMIWIFIQDDQYDTTASLANNIDHLRKRLEKFAEITTGAAFTPGLNITVNTLAELIDAITRTSDPSWVKRFSRSLSDFWLLGVLVEVVTRSKKIVLDLDAYMKMRRYSVCMLPMLDLIEYAHGFVLTEDTLQNLAFQRMKQLTIDILIYTNDIFSYKKEQKAGDPHNLIHIFMHHEKLSFANAVDRVVQMHDSAVKLFIQQTEILLDMPPPSRSHITTYVNGCRAWIRGALDWQLLANRYASGRIYLQAVQGEPV